MDWLDLLAVQGTLKSLLQHHSSKASILRRSALFTVQLSHPYLTTGKTIAMARWTFVDKVMFLPFFLFVFCLAHLTFSDELSTLKMRFYTNPHISALARKPHRRPPLGSKRGGDGTQAPRVQGTPQPRFVPALLFPVFWVVSFRCKIPILSLQGFPDTVAREGPFAGSNPRAHCLNPPRELGSRGPTALLLGG